MKISIDTINKLADLAYLNITNDESISLIDDFGRIIEMIDNISSVKVHDLTKRLDDYSPLRPDAIEHSPILKSINSFEQYSADANCFVVPKVVEQE
ncbi:MAG: hypothetical protein CMF41_03630 [Legionellales bacterium]|nr:hypothetical protein [Legionellales bacterium]|tara:strand:- start:905 stop:1192 length:288 start_codon:yes stop_codon:yes gene_type:complete